MSLVPVTNGAVPFLAGSGVIPALQTGANVVGMNLTGLAYYSTEFPFLNLMKSGGVANGTTSGATGWITGTSTLFETNEESYLQLDSDGYATSLTASPTPPGGQQFTNIHTWLSLNSNLGYGATAYLPIGASNSYRFKAIGLGAYQISGVTGIVSGPGTYSGGTVTINNTTANTYFETVITVNASASTAIQLTILSITSATDYPRDISFVQNEYAASYDGGEVFHPAFLASVANIQCFRFMDWQSTNLELQRWTATGNIAASATSCTIGSSFLATISGTVMTVTSMNGQLFVGDAITGPGVTAGTTIASFGTGQGSTGTYNLSASSTISTATALGGAHPWVFPSQTRNIIFTDGEQRTATFTLGSSTVTWTPALTNAITVPTSYGPTFSVSWHDSFANRPKPSNAFWSLQNYGIPMEVAVALCNKTGADMWTTIPLMVTDADAASYAQAIINGTGFQSGWAALSSGLNWRFQISNEIWNPGFTQFAVAGQLGQAIWPTQSGATQTSWNLNWKGMRIAQLASGIQTSLGSTAFSRVYPTFDGWAANGDTDMLTTPYWTAGPATNYPVKQFCIAPYWMDSYPSQTDVNTITAQPDGGLAYLYACFFSNTPAAGVTLSSVPANGWLGAAEANVTARQAAVGTPTSTYPNIALVCYECGQNMLYGGTQPTGWATAAEAFQRSSYAGQVYASWLAWWKANAGNTRNTVCCQFTDSSPLGTETWGVIEGMTQPLNATNTPKWQAIQTFIATG